MPDPAPLGLGQSDSVPPREFWREVPCGHPPDPLAWVGPDGPVCHCGTYLDEAEALPSGLTPPSIHALIQCGNCGCFVGIPTGDHADA